MYRGTQIPRSAACTFRRQLPPEHDRPSTQANGALAGEALSDRGTSSITTFGEDDNGELYVLTARRHVYRIDPA